MPYSTISAARASSAHFKLLAPGGTLVAYGAAAQRDDTSDVLITFLGVEGRLTMWSLAPNGRRALFCNFWAAITPHVAARMPLAEAGAAMTLAESRTAYGKVVLVPCSL
jgi:NADPH:quinone reductase-like Zn-dependent oxidoreductase